MNEAAEGGPLKSLPGLSREKFIETCDLSPEEVKEICQAVDKIRVQVEEARASSKRATSDEALRELSILELQDALDGVTALIEKYGEHRPGIAPLVILRSLASIALIARRTS